LSTIRAIENLALVEEEINLLVESKKIDFEEYKNPPPQKKFENFILLPNKREDLKGKVLKPGWTLPTMTVEEWAEKELEKMQIIDSNKPKPPPKKTPEELEDDDTELKKTRDWDDYRDAHKKGDGNKNDFYFKRS